MLNKEMDIHKDEKPSTTPKIDMDMTTEFQKQIKNSPKWAEIVKEYGEEKAEELLKECKAEFK